VPGRPRLSLINGLTRTKESRAWPGHPILIPRGGHRPWGSYQQSTGNRCAEGRFSRSRSTVGVEVKCSNDLQLSALPTCRNRTDIALITADSVTSLRFFTAIYLRIHLYYATSASLYHLHQHFLTNLTRSRSPFLRLIALPSYHPNPTHDRAASWDGWMFGGSAVAECSDAAQTMPTLPLRSNVANVLVIGTGAAGLRAASPPTRLAARSWWLASVAATTPHGAGGWRDQRRPR